MAQIDVIHIRAKIIFNDSKSVVTPNIKSFNVNRNRGAISTFSASLRVLTEEVQDLVGSVTIYSGTSDNMIKIFSGYVKTVTPSPCWEDPKYFIVNITGVDELHKLENRRFTRRQVYSDSTWALITRVVSKGKRHGKLKLAPQAPLLVTSNKDTFDKEGVAKNDGKSLGPEPHAVGGKNEEFLRPKIKIVPKQ